MSQKQGHQPEGRIEAMFGRCAESGRRALIPFITAGDPSTRDTVDLMHALVAGGADLIELGVPFSDPIADGPVIQAASERAIERGVNLAWVLAQVEAFRQKDSVTPVLLMGYLNPIERFGYEAFAEQAAAAGVDAVLLVDCPPEESDTFSPLFAQHNLRQIFLVAPTTDERRARLIAEQAGGFIYLVALKGVTGAAMADADALQSQVNRVRAVSDLPLAIGFGIKQPDDAVTLSRFAEGVVVGSALVEALQSSEASPAEAGRAFLEPFRKALDDDAEG